MSRFWGWPERLVVVMVLMVLTVMQVGIASKVFADATGEVAEVFSFAYNVLGIMLTAMVLTVMAGTIRVLIRANFPERLTTQLDRLLTCVLGLSVAAYVGYHGLTTGGEYPLNPEFATAELIYSGVFVVLFLARARPIRTLRMLWREYQEPTGVPA